MEGGRPERQQHMRQPPTDSYTHKCESWSEKSLLICFSPRAPNALSTLLLLTPAKKIPFSRVSPACSLTHIGYIHSRVTLLCCLRSRSCLCVCLFQAYRCCDLFRLLHPDCQTSTGSATDPGRIHTLARRVCSFQTLFCWQQISSAAICYSDRTAGIFSQRRD